MSLPVAWTQAPLRDLAQVITKGTTPTTLGFAYQKSGIAFVKVENLVNGQIDPATISDFINEEAHTKLSRSQLKTRDVLVSIAGTIGRIATVKAEDLPANTNQAVGIIRGIDQIFDSKYLRYFFESPQSQSQLQPAARGGAMNNISLTDLGNVETLIAPLAEQVRIVAEIEKQFTRLDDAVAALKRVQANLKRYRASVLKAACQGRLVPTEAELARKEGRSYEPASELLKRILAERRAKWEADQLQKMIAAGKPPKNGEWKNAYKEPDAPDVRNLSKLPEGWAWAAPEQLSQFDDNAICAGPFGTIFKAKDFRPEGVPIIFLRHVAPGRYLTHKPGFMDKQKWEQLFRPYSVFGGELLITKLGEPPGVCALYPEGLGPAMVTPDVIKFSPHWAVAIPKYLMHYFNSESARRFYTGIAFGTTRLRVTLPLFRSMPVPLPPMPEQTRIVEEVEHRQTMEDAVGHAILTQSLRATRLRQSILRTAFAGKLVPQDPNDESASGLLERIRAERAALATNNGNHKAALDVGTNNKQRRRRVAKLAQGVSPGKPERKR